MAKQFIVATQPAPIYVNETGTQDEIVPTVYLNESSPTAKPATLLRLIGVGTW